jgi:D-tyrosyl-tRNA(Tyr) deacylase
MKVVVQRVSQARVDIDGEPAGVIGNGLLVLLGIQCGEDNSEIDWLVKKLINLRIFNDDNGVMNRSVLESGGDILVVSQFTLHARTKKGNRPSYINAAPPEVAIPLYEEFLSALEDGLGKKVERGVFGADMKVSLVNDGPVTIIIDTLNKE